MPTPNDSASFQGDRKVGRWATAPLERRFVERGLPHIPGWLETHHLTLLTLVWSGLAVACGALAAHLHPLWLLGLHVAVCGQYLSDLFDGAVGRARDTGLVRWGFYMDHLLDFVFLGAFWLAYLWVLPANALPWLALLVALSGALMAHSFLAFGATGVFRISHFGVGPTETRIGLLALNGAVVVLGPGWLAAWLPGLAGAAALVLAAVVFQTQRELWRSDVAAKRATAEAPSGTLQRCHTEV